MLATPTLSDFCFFFFDMLTQEKKAENRKHSNVFSKLEMIKTKYGYHCKFSSESQTAHAYGRSVKTAYKNLILNLK